MKLTSFSTGILSLNATEKTLAAEFSIHLYPTTILDILDCNRIIHSPQIITSSNWLEIVTNDSLVKCRLKFVNSHEIFQHVRPHEMDIIDMVGTYEKKKSKIAVI